MTSPQASKTFDTNVYSPNHSSTTFDSLEIRSSSSATDDDVHSEHEKRLTPHVSRRNSDGLTRHQTTTSIATNATQDPAYEVDFTEGDPEDPKNWPRWYRYSIVALMSYSTTTVVLYSTSYASTIPGLQKDFNYPEETIPVLGITTYLLGLALGSVILAPLSEMYGRRPIYLIAQSMFTILILPCALAQNMSTILITRFFGAIAGAAMIGNAPGTLNDIVHEEYRALTMSVWSCGPMLGPIWGPLFSGFVYEDLGWRWVNWVVVILSGLTIIAVSLVKETYAPTVLRKKAAVLRKETGDSRWHSRYDEKRPLGELLLFNLKRPLVMAATEPICIFFNVFIAVVYGILYLCFVAYPIVFGERGWSYGYIGLSYVGIGIGSLITIAMEPIYRKLINKHKVDPETGKPPPEAMMSVVCIASILIPIGEMIFAWTCTPNVHWIAPIIAGIPFGAGNAAVFIYATNYLVYSYGIYAASALAGNAVFRSIMGGTLPLAGPTIYRSLGPNWAGTMLALLEIALIPIPFVFYRYGHKIRMKSGLIRRMQEDKDRLDGKKRAAEDREQKLAEAMIAAEAVEVPAPVVGFSSTTMEKEAVEEIYRDV